MLLNQVVQHQHYEAERSTQSINHEQGDDRYGPEGVLPTAAGAVQQIGRPTHLQRKLNRS